MDQDNRIVAVVAGWNRDAVLKQASFITEDLGICALYYVKYEYEPDVINGAIADCIAFTDAEYMWYTEPDVSLGGYTDTGPAMANYLDLHENVVLIRPNREGERPRQLIYKKYMDDGTAWMFRLSSPARWDSDFIFTGWGDIDFSNTVEHLHELPTLFELRSVYKNPSAYGSWSTYREAYNARNRLLLEAKWYWVGIEDWVDVETYNNDSPPNKKLPGAIQMAGWSKERHRLFVDSVDLEHPQIRIGETGQPGNQDWVMPWEV